MKQGEKTETVNKVGGKRKGKKKRTLEIWNPTHATNYMVKTLHDNFLFWGVGGKYNHVVATTSTFQLCYGPL